MRLCMTCLRYGLCHLTIFRKIMRAIGKTRTLTVISVVALFGLVIAVCLASYLGFKLNTHREKSDAFARIIAANVQLNDGVTINELGQGLSLGETRAGASLSFVVLNHTNEAIEFANMAYGLQGYTYDNWNGQWKRVEFLYHPEERSTILPPKIESLDLVVLNTWTVSFEQVLPPGLSGEIRFFVRGIGMSTGLEYGAYMDVMVRNHK